jgi:hypothetical protein
LILRQRLALTRNQRFRNGRIAAEVAARHDWIRPGGSLDGHVTIKGISMSRILVWILPMVFSAVVLMHHFSNPSMISTFGESKEQINAKIGKVVLLHEQHPTFKRRMGTTWLIRACAGAGLDIYQSFVSIQFLLMVGCGLLLGSVCRRLQVSKLEEAVAQILFYGSYTVLFSFFAPIYSYDEFLQYFMVLAGLYFCLSNRVLALSIALLIAGLVRETTVFLLPGFYVIGGHKTGRFRLAAVLSGVGILIFMFVYVLAQNSPAGRGMGLAYRLSHLSFNFAGIERFRESVFSFLLALGVPFALAVSRPFCRLNYSAWDRRVVCAAVITLAVNSPVVFVSAFAREARLFALPLLFIWPFAGVWLVQLVVRTRASMRVRFQSGLIFLALSTAIASGVLTWFFYTGTSTPFLAGMRNYAVLCTSMMAFTICLGSWTSNQSLKLQGILTGSGCVSARCASGQTAPAPWSASDSDRH